MKDAFRAYYPPTEAELTGLWSEGLVILDANALLHFFRYTPKTRDAFFSVLDAKKDAVWIPHQVGLEFHRNKHDVMAQQKQAFSKTVAALEGIQKQADDAFDKLEIKRHSALDIRAMKAAIKEVTDKLAKETEELKAQHEEASSRQEHDHTLGHISTLYAGRVGGPFNEDELSTLYSEGKKRYSLKRPPGYKDAGKGEPAMYGDLVLWKQILRQAQEQHKPAIFVTDDLKDDWWLEVGGEKKGARPELVDEFLEASGGQRIHFYTPDRFLDFARNRGVDVSREAQHEVEQVSQAASLLDYSGAIHTVGLDWRQLSPLAIFGLSTRDRDLVSRIQALEQHHNELRRRRHELESRIADLWPSDRDLEDESFIGSLLAEELQESSTTGEELERVAQELEEAKAEWAWHQSHPGTSRLTPWADQLAREARLRADLDNAKRSDGGPA